MSGNNGTKREENESQYAKSALRDETNGTTWEGKASYGEKKWT